MEERTWGIIGGIVLVIAVLSSLFLGSSKHVQKLYNEGEALYTHRKYLEAVEKYNKAIKASKKLGARPEVINKDFPALANYKIALCYDKLGETNNDITYYTRAITIVKKTLCETEVYKHKENLTYLWAQLLYKTERFLEAEAKYTSFVKVYPNSCYVEEALIHIGTINSELHNHEKALTAFQRVIEEFPSSQYRNEAEYYIPKVLVDENQPDNFQNKNEVERMYNTAVDKLNQNQDYAAYQLFSGIIKQFPESVYVSLAYEGIGDIYNRVVNYVNARQNYENAMHSATDIERKQELLKKYQETFLVPEPPDPVEPKQNHNSTLFVKANLLRIEEKFVEAAPLYESLSNSNIPKDDIVYSLYWGGYCYQQSANFSKSEELLNRLIREFSNSPKVVKTYYQLALTYSKWAKTDGGNLPYYHLVIQTVDEAIEKYSITEINSDLRWLSQMRAIRAEAVDNIPNPNPINVPDPSPYEIKFKHYDQALVFLHENLYNQAITEFEKCLEIDPYFIKAYCNLGVIYINKKNYTKAIDELNEAIYIDTQFKEAHFNIGLAYLRLGRYEDAKIAANAALQIDPNYEAAQALRESIAD